MSKDPKQLKIEIEGLKNQLSIKQQKLNEVLKGDSDPAFTSVLEIIPKEETKQTVDLVSGSGMIFEEKVQELFLDFERNRLRRDNFRTYMYFFSFPVVLIFLVACSYAIYKNPTDKSILGVGAAALTALLTLLGYSSYKKNKE